VFSHRENEEDRGQQERYAKKRKQKRGRTIRSCHRGGAIEGGRIPRQGRGINNALIYNGGDPEKSWPISQGRRERQFIFCLIGGEGGSEKREVLKIFDR